MKKIILTIFIIPFPLFSQWFWQNPLPQGNTLVGIHFVDDSVGYAAAGWGSILKTTNGGISWDIQSTQTIIGIHSIFFSDIDNGFLVGRYSNNDSTGNILRTTDGGQTWSRFSIGTSNVLMDVSFADKSNGLVVGSDGIILKSIDGGDTWNRINATTEHLNL